MAWRPGEMGDDDRNEEEDDDDDDDNDDDEGEIGSNEGYD